MLPITSLLPCFPRCLQFMEPTLGSIYPKRSLGPVPPLASSTLKNFPLRVQIVGCHKHQGDGMSNFSKWFMLFSSVPRLEVEKLTTMLKEREDTIHHLERKCDLLMARVREFSQAPDHHEHDRGLRVTSFDYW